MGILHQQKDVPVAKHGALFSAADFQSVCFFVFFWQGAVPSVVSNVVMGFKGGVGWRVDCFYKAGVCI